MPYLHSLSMIGDNIRTIDGKPFYNLSRLEIIDLSHNRLNDIEELFQFESSPNRMKRLSLAYNEIDYIPGDAFVELTSLRELDLSYNLISDLTEEPFANLSILSTLKLNNNRIKDLNGAVNSLDNLKHLFLSGNKIRHIDVPSLKIIYELETFDISNNQLESIKPVVFSRHWNHFVRNSICVIKLSGNQITSIPNATSREILERYTRSQTSKFAPVDVLTELDLSSNMISNIQFDAFQSVVRLSNLDLSQNKLIDFIINPRDLEHVKYLNLSYNFLQNLHFESFLYMSNLQNLDLSYNNLDDIPDQTFLSTYNLKHVNMTYNEIKALKNLGIKFFHPEGGVLDLSNNGLFKINIPAGDGLHLNILLLNSNNISDASLIDLYYQNELKSLDMSNNSIQALDENSLRLPLVLSVLDLSNNCIEKISPASFHRVSHLKTLRLGHNKINNVEYGAFQGLSSLMYLDLSFNNINFLDSKVLMDLKSLAILSLRFNDLYMLEYKSWLGHKFNLKVYMEGNRFSCDWLGKALSDFNNGYSKMRPSVLIESVTGHSLEGIPCESEIGELAKMPQEAAVMADERLLVLTQKILEAVRDQNSFMRRYLWGSEQEPERLRRI